MNVNKLYALSRRVDETPPMDLPNCQRRKAIRRAAGLSMQDAACIIGSTALTVRNLEEGVTKGTTALAVRYASLLAVLTGSDKSAA